MTPCSVPSCTQVVHRRAHCRAHYEAFLGTASMPRLASIPLDERFWAKVERRGDGECWPWRGATSPGGYGRFRAPNTSVATRFLMSDLLGYDLTDRHVMHICDNPPCVNPRHLVVGTPQENIADMHRKGRHRSRTLHGEEAPWARLTEQAIRDIRFRINSGARARDLAKEYGVSRTHIHNIASRRCWKHVA